MQERRSLPLATIAVAVALVLAPNLGLPGLLAHDAQRVIQVVALAYVAAWFAASSELRQRAGDIVLAHPLPWSAVAVAFALGVLSSLLAPSPALGLLEVGLLAASVGATLAVAAEITTSPGRALRTVLVAAAVALTLQLAPMPLLLDLTEGTRPLWSEGGLAGGFSHPRFLNQLQAITLPLVGALCVSEDRRIRWGARAVAAVSAWSMVLTEGRGATLSVLLVLVALAVVGRQAGRRWARALAVPFVAGAGTAIATRTLVTIPGLRGAEALASDSGRSDIWRDALERLADAPLLGVGPAHLAHLDVVTDHFTNGWPAHPHNLVVQLVVEWGLAAGLLVVGVLVVGGVRLLFHRWDDQLPRVAGVPGDVVGAAATAAVGAGLALAQLSGVAVMPTALLAMTLAGGAAVGLTHRARRHELRSRSGPAVGVSVALAMLAATVLLVVEVGIRPAQEQSESVNRYVAAFEEAFPDRDPVLDPRFWIQGWTGLP